MLLGEYSETVLLRDIFDANTKVRSIIGATVMPHSILLGSKMATMKRLSTEQYEADLDDQALQRVSSSNNGPSLHMPQPVRLGTFDLRGDGPGSSNRRPSQLSVPRASDGTNDKEADEQDDYDDNAQPPSLACIRAHLTHAIFDICGSLVGFAVVINSAILIVGAAVFYYGDGRTGTSDGVSDLFDAFELVKQYVGARKSAKCLLCVARLTLWLFRSFCLLVCCRTVCIRPSSFSHCYADRSNHFGRLHSLAHQALEAANRDATDWHRPFARGSHLCRTSRDRQLARRQPSRAELGLAVRRHAAHRLLREPRYDVCPDFVRLGRQARSFISTKEGGDHRSTTDHAVLARQKL